MTVYFAMTNSGQLVISPSRIALEIAVPVHQRVILPQLEALPSSAKTDRLVDFRDDAFLDAFNLQPTEKDCKTASTPRQEEKLMGVVAHFLNIWAIADAERRGDPCPTRDKDIPSRDRKLAKAAYEYYGALYKLIREGWSQIGDGLHKDNFEHFFPFQQPGTMFKAIVHRGFRRSITAGLERTTVSVKTAKEVLTQAKGDDWRARKEYRERERSSAAIAFTETRLDELEPLDCLPQLCYQYAKTRGSRDPSLQEAYKNYDNKRRNYLNQIRIASRGCSSG